MIIPSITHLRTTLLPVVDANILSSSSSGLCNDIYKCRTLPQILWSCISVVIACTWVSVHPNIPGPKESCRRIFRRRIGLMITALIAPELLVLWAARQWFAARKLSNLKAYKDHNWTVSHAFFALMGGFALYEGEKCISVLRYYPEKAAPDSPSKMSKREVRDRSHRDVLGKLFAVGQTTWFVVQLVARWAKDLPITELEIMTLAFATMNVMIYYFWWDKPQDVGCHVRIQRRTNNENFVGQPNDSVQENEGWVRNFWNDCRKRGILNGIMDWIILPPLKALMQALLEGVPERIFEDAGIALKLALVMLYIIAAPLVVLAFMIIADEQYQDEKMSLLERTEDLEPEYAEDNLIMYGATVLFGAIHCLAWTFKFPSTTEQLLWRTCALLVTFLPLFLALYHLIYDKHIAFRGREPRWASWFTFFALVIFLFYLFARISLIVQAFLALRDLPPGAFEVAQWTSFLPHI
ncbi:hypothetical protein GYMLUDRAFT_1024781 [Collybiopsis luxurians FD-317 M1]|uniref:Unplaced genomic scaffold GYMLUscaffold_74, whole genome shotgun sequence n=1 Tax=Collybiopsis luxurians FD-317 M1 TaxID=944289 RepID=A0A0D0C7Q9_9AGAR|nr:hypothetical protein GYMLUDRAFT_1024781 [Collybiopsis luxurians FD-317 M1]